MNDDSLVAGMFGVLATMLGVVAAYALSFSQDRRRARSQYVSALETVIREVQRIAAANTDSSCPSLRGLEVLLLHPSLSRIPSDLGLRLAQFFSRSEQINDATESLRQLSHGLLVSGALERLAKRGEEPGISGDGFVDLRSQLVHDQARDVPQLISDIKLERDKCK